MWYSQVPGKGSRNQVRVPRDVGDDTIRALSGNVKAVLWGAYYHKRSNGSYISAHGGLSHSSLQVPDITREKTAPTQQQPRRQTLEGAAQQLRERGVLIVFPSSSRCLVCQGG